MNRRCGNDRIRDLALPDVNLPWNEGMCVVPLQLNPFVVSHARSCRSIIQLRKGHIRNKRLRIVCVGWVINFVVLFTFGPKWPLFKIHRYAVMGSSI